MTDWTDPFLKDPKLTGIINAKVDQNLLLMDTSENSSKLF